MKRYATQICIALLLIAGIATYKALAQNKPGGPLAKQLIGEWRNVYVKVIMNTYNNTDKTLNMEADSSNWEARLKIKPIRTHFKADGTYYSEYRNLKDSIVRMPSGTWTILKGDSLVMTQLKPDRSVLTVHVQIEKNTATFHGLIDFDGDGKTDDEYFGRQRKYQQQ